jgi:conjugative transfer pilus assembly protein TraH
MNSFFQGMGMSTNSTPASVYQGQEAGYYSAGGLYMRTPNKNLQFAQITVPSLTAGCGGIDLFMGGMSFVKGPQLIQFAHSMLSEAAPVAFNIALQTVSPTLSNIFQSFESFANEINEGNLNACTADYAVAGLLTQGTAANQHACQDLNAQGGEFADWVGSHEGCAGSDSGSDYNNVNNNATGKQETTVNKNIVWAALMQSPMYNNNYPLAMFMMSLSGTIVYDQNGNPTTFPPLALDQDMLNSMMYGGNVTVYSCGGDIQNCLDPSTTQVTIDAGNAFGTVINSYLVGTGSISDNYVNDKPLTTSQQAFLGSVESVMPGNCGNG